MGKCVYFTCLFSALFKMRQYRALFAVLFLQSTRAANWAAMKTLCSPSVPAAVTMGRLQSDGIRMRCPQDLLCGHILFNQLARFLVPLQKVFVMPCSSAILLSSVLNTTANNTMNTNISFLSLRANRLIFMMHTLSINQFILWKENFNVQYFCWFYVFYCRCAWVFFLKLCCIAQHRKLHQ